MYTVQINAPWVSQESQKLSAIFIHMGKSVAIIFSYCYKDLFAQHTEACHQIMTTTTKGAITVCT